MSLRGAWLGALALAGVVAGTLAVALPQGALAATTAASTPDTPFYGNPFAASVKPGEKMLVEATQLVYDYDKRTVAAVGNVRIFYGQYTITADRVTYAETTGRLVADGNVTLVDPTGNRFRSTHVDLTSNFRDAFIASLQLDTPQRTHFFADTAERKSGDTVTFVNGSYTACEICQEEPQKPPLWNVRAAKIVVNEKEQTVAFTDARLEFFGRPIAWIPYFTITDPTVKRKTGFLWPTIGISKRLGVSARVPYYWALDPSYDLTFSPTIYSRQGLLGELEWRQRLDNGEYSVKVAGIAQQDKSAFDNTSSSYRDLRGGVRTIGDFDINSSWSYGWDATLLSDRTFTRDYKTLSTENSEIVSNVHLTGIGNRNFFDARATAYQILTEPSAAPVLNPGKFDQGRQAYAVPVIDYRHLSNPTAHDGELTMTSNLTSLVRQEDDPFPVGVDTYYSGTAGTTVRASQEIAWQRQMIGANGQVVTPFAYVRGDAYFLNANTAASTVTGSSTAFRGMPAAGVEWSYPLLVRSPMATQILEPKAQLILRSNEMGIGSVPNNDAQSLVYEVANLFERDKFSGWDRNEGGGRLNLGLHYNGSFTNGAAIDWTFGQSFHLLGQNSFAVADVANVGPTSGLETQRSDYVGALRFDTGLGPSVQMKGRFDERTFTINRAELEATAALGPVTASAAYFYLRQNPNNDSSLPGPASVVHGAASVSLSEYWRAFGSFAYDVTKAAIASNSLGFAFDNSCLTFAVSYNQTRKNYTDLVPDRAISFRLELRTLGEASVTGSLNDVK